jgi:hypothetical protein
MLFCVVDGCCRVFARSTGEGISEHWETAFRFSFGRLVLKHVPMFGEAAILDPDHVCGYRCNGTAVACEAAVDNDVIAFSYDELVFVAQSNRRASDKV